VLHVHGTTLNLNLNLLVRSVARNGSSVLLHYHGGYPARSAFGRKLQRANFEQTARYGFTTASHAQPFIDGGLLNHPERVFELMETSSTFRWRDRSDARRETGMLGDPVCLSVGRLHEIKDPLTMLRGFDCIQSIRPSAELYLYYLTDECLATMREFLVSRPELRAHVHFCGRAAFAEMEAIYNSADFVLQASTREFSGNAVLEAMACGVIPVVTDIPSFRAMTADGQFGILFPIGDAEALARQVLAIDASSIAERSEAIRAHFERALSFRALANQLIPVYREMIAERPSVTTTSPVAR
jgi:glycosyltransferase involved in cell wall biosynthesis